MSRLTSLPSAKQELHKLLAHSLKSSNSIVSKHSLGINFLFCIVRVINNRIHALTSISCRTPLSIINIRNRCSSKPHGWSTLRTTRNLNIQHHGHALLSVLTNLKESGPREELGIIRIENRWWSTDEDSNNRS